MIDLLNRIGFRQIAFGGEGGGGGGAKGRPAASNNVVSGAPRQAELMDQPHMLAYINPQEEQMLRDAGGAGIPGPDGIPVYGWWSDTWKEFTSGGAADTETYNGGSNNNNDSGSSDPGSGTGDDGWGDWDATADWGQDDSNDSYDYGYDPYEDADLYDDDGYQPEYSGPDYGGGGGGGGGGNNDNDDYGYDPYEDADLYDDDGYQPEYSGPDYGGNDNNDNDDRQPTPPPPPPPPPAPAPIIYDPYEDASLYGDGGYQQEYSGSNYGGSSNNSVTETTGALPVDGGLGVSPVPRPRPENLIMGRSPIGPTVTVSTQDESNIAEGRFEGIRDKLEALGYTVSANGSSVYTADGQVAGENWSGSSTISNMLKENQDQNGALAPINNNPTAKAPVNTQTFGALPDGVTQQMITDSQNDGEYGYYNNDGSFVPANIDKYNGGGPDYSGVAFASGGGAQFDLDGDRFLSKTEMGIGEAAGKELDQNFWSKAGTGLGGTPLGSGQDPTGVAKWAEKLIVPGGSTLRKLNPPAFERPLSSYDPNNPYADVGENAPNIWWEKGKTNPIGFEYKRTPAEVLADRTASREKAAIDAANEITNNDNDSGPRTRREDLFGTRMTTEEYRRRYKGGGGAALPAYMRKYASGKSIDELVRKVKVNGKDYFLTPDGRYIEPSAFTGAAASRDIDVVETGEEQYLEGYNVIDESTGIITTYNTDGSIMEVFDPNFESEEA
jgi:hypothetical protein